MAWEKERWQRIEGILDEALELPKGEVPAFLDQACASDADLRRDVERLLAADHEAGSFLELWAADYAATLVGETPSQALPEDLPQLGPYRIVSKIGSGAMGVVFEAEDTRLHRQVAIKLLPPSVGADTQAKERFLREARSISALDHPNLCTVHDIGETEDGLVYLVMTYYGRQTLAHRLADGPLPAEKARELAVQIARGLERAHEAGVIHRDVKPANVLVTERGEAKIVDFGIAKVLGEVALSRTGTSPGTPAYMSPEQAGGEDLDPRTDLWSLGVVLYEMLTGQKPFEGQSMHSMLSAIRYRDPEPLNRWCDDVSEALRAVVAKALTKDREKRYANATEMIADLEAAAQPAPARKAARRRGPLAVAASLLAFLLVAGGWWAAHRTGLPKPVKTPAATREVKSRTSLAVLFFQNLTGDPELDWLRNGITEMVVTDLSQSPELDVLSTGRLYQVLEKLDAADGRSLSSELLRRFAAQSTVGLVVRGSFVRVADVLRITFTVEDALTGKILRSADVEGSGEESLFDMVDSLSATIRESLSVTRLPEIAESIEDATTSSIEAWRLYTEAVSLYNYSRRREEGVTLLERAVELDPQFAQALASLALMYANLGHENRSREAMHRAFVLANRLPLDQRYWVQGTYYGSRWSTTGQAIEVYEEGLRYYPERNIWRHNLARRYAFVEDYEKALEHFERLIAGGMKAPQTYVDAAYVYGALGDEDRGYRLLTDFAKTAPETWYIEFALGWNLTDWNRWKEADSHLRRATELAPGEPWVDYGRWRWEILSENWTLARQAAESLLASDDPFALWLGAVAMGRTLLFRGRSEEALRWFEKAAGAYPEPGAYTALARCWSAELHLHRGEPSAALDDAQRAQEEGREEWPELRGLFLAARAQQALALPAAADVSAAALRRLSHPNRVEERQLLHLAGLLALERGETAAALEALTSAAELLAPRGLEYHWQVYPDHVAVYSALARAELAAGRPDDARRHLMRVADIGSERLEQPVLYVRSLAALGDLDREAGEEEAARELYGRFLRYFKDGDLDRGSVEAARSVPRS